MRALATAALLLTVLTACGSGSSSTSATKSSTSTSATGATSSSSPTETTTKATGGATTPVSVAPTQPTAHLVAVRAARQDTVDRVVFEFSDRVPGYKIAYGKKPIVGTSGKEVPLAGTAALVVHMQAATGFNLDTGQPTYTGPQHVQPAGTRAVDEVAQVEDFEGVLTWAVGLNAELAFRVSALTSPPRLVIDIAS
jgi:hypothetical protein